MPLIKLDFSRVTYPGALEIIAPIIPGGILTFGTLILNPGLAAEILSNPFWGYRSRVVAAIFVSYVAGLLLYLLVGYTSYFVGYQLGTYLGPLIFTDPPAPWRNLGWRRVAGKLLGPDLAPTTDELYFKDLHTEQLKRASEIQDPDERAKQQKFVTDFFLPRSIADSDWYWWYQVLGAYFTKAEWWAPPAQYFLSMLHTASWAVILLMVSNHRHHWFAWLLCILGLFFGNVGSWFDTLRVQSNLSAMLERRNAMDAASVFNRLSKRSARTAGHAAAFFVAALVILIWAATGPMFRFSDTWQLVITTTIVTFLMVFLIQNTQNRDSQAMQLKLDELIRAIEGAHNSLLDLEELTEEELDLIRGRYEQLAEKARKELRKGRPDTGRPNV